MHILLLHFCWWKRSVSLGFVFSLKEPELSMEHMVTVACDSPPALPLKPCSPIQYPPPPQWESPLLSVTALNNGVTLLFLVKYESMYIYVKWQQDFHFEGRHCHVLSACGLLKMEQGDKWERKRTRCEEKEKNIQSCKYVTTVSLKKTFSSKPQQCSLCE